jgi:hypothetical protein
VSVQLFEMTVCHSREACPQLDWGAGINTVDSEFSLIIPDPQFIGDDKRRF